MKRIVLSLVIVGAFITSNAQSETNKTLEQLRSELDAKTKEKDYNPYRYSKENFVIACLEVRTEWERDNCESLKGFIERFNEIDSNASDGEIQDIVNDISLFRCKEAYDFLEIQIKNNPSEVVRCNAIIFLAWNLNTNYLPCILEYAKKESLSVQEKLALGSAFMIYGVYTFNSELREKSIKFLDEICYNSSLDIFAHCDACYMKLGGKSAIDFYTSWGKQQEGFRKITAAVFLAQLGEYETTYQIFIEAIHSNIPNYVYEAIRGLSVIGTEEALRLIETQTQNKNEMIAKKAQGVINDFEKGGQE